MPSQVESTSTGDRGRLRPARSGVENIPIAQANAQMAMMTIAQVAASPRVERDAWAISATDFIAAPPLMFEVAHFQCTALPPPAHPIFQLTEITLNAPRKLIEELAEVSTWPER